MSKRRIGIKYLLILFAIVLILDSTDMHLKLTQTKSILLEIGIFVKIVNDYRK